MKKIVFYIIPLCIALSGCISEYEHSGIDNISDILVVEGIISDDTTSIRLSRTIGLTEKETKYPAVNNAIVSVETESGLVFNTEDDPNNGLYKIFVGVLISDTRYRLRIELDGNTYISEYTEPLETPRIESVNLYKKAMGEPVQLRISTQNEENASRYYMWSYDEIWEYSAPIAAMHYQEPYLNGEAGPKNVYAYDPYSPYYYCWSYGNSNRILLGSSVKLSINRIDNLTLASFPANSSRFTILYYIKVKQNALSKEAYNYFYNLKENAESTGSIFGPVPSESKGNIACVTDESIPVIGFIEVSHNQWYEDFFSSFSELSEYSVSPCPSVEGEEEAEELGYEWGSLTIYFEGIMGNLYTLPNCIDCTARGGYHDRKPYFWPNDHI